MTAAPLLRIPSVDSARKPEAHRAHPESRAPGDAALRLVSAASSERDLIERLSPVVHKLLWSFLGPDPERDDLAHEIFIRILKAAAKVRDPERLEQWAARVTINAVKNEFRSRKLRRLLRLQPDPEVEEPRYHPDFEGRELLQRTYRLFELLPARERIPLTLRLLQGVSAEEIARLSGCSERSVKRRLQAGRERFLSLARRDPLLAARLASVTNLVEGGDDD